MMAEVKRILSRTVLRPSRLRNGGGTAVLLIACLLPVAGCSVTGIRLTPLADDVQLGTTYTMKEKPWTLADHYIIGNDRKQKLFQVRGRVFSLGDKLTISDMEGNELIQITEKVFSLLNRYHIVRADGSSAVFREDLHLFNEKFTILIPGEADYIVRGDFLDHEYAFYRHDRLVALVSKKLFSWTDSYAIQVVRGEDDLLILAAAVIIDKIKEDNEEQAAPTPFLLQ